MEVNKIRFAEGITQLPKEERPAQKTCPRNLISILHGETHGNYVFKINLLSPQEPVDSLVFIHGWGRGLRFSKTFWDSGLNFVDVFFSLTCHILSL